jgi:hypothetical protein
MIKSAVDYLPNERMDDQNLRLIAFTSNIKDKNDLEGRTLPLIPLGIKQENTNFEVEDQEIENFHSLEIDYETEDILISEFEGLDDPNGIQYNSDELFVSNLNYTGEGYLLGRIVKIENGIRHYSLSPTSYKQLERNVRVELLKK